MRTLKSISTAVMLITGIITAVTGAIETIMKLVDKSYPATVLPPPPPMTMEKSLRGLPEYIAIIPDVTFWTEWHGPILWAAGLVAIITAIVISSTNKTQ